MEQRRDNTVTIVKAIGIILMVWGHAVVWGTPVCNVIYTFHMPLFFLMSGYCFKEKYLGDAKQFVIRKLKGIYIPYVAFSLIFLALHNVFTQIYIYDAGWTYGWKDFAWHTSRIVTRMSSSEYLLSPFWFLKELFWGNLIFYATYKLVKWGIEKWRLKIGDLKLGAEWVTAIGLFVLAEVTCVLHFRVPYFTITSTTIYAAFFIALGYLWKKSEFNPDKWWIWLLGIAAVALEVVLVGGTAVNDRTPVTMLYYTIPAILGTMVVFNLSKYIDKVLSGWGKTVVLFLGNHTIFIVALQFLVFRLVAYCYIQMNGLPIERLLDSPTMKELASNGWGVLAYTVVGVLVPLALEYVWTIVKKKVVK
jgi:fucose 4-O-acetylase-like acetyltransferase